ncbi:alpha/beta fold hydrolase [Rhodococcus wratislaviensis]|uniref:AB hydrolase-1 domain-containing protein n=1 Tax=Rhodococcus wratislaviensis NBRC 100605 TaxID=1219028 RepID=X0Q0I4_RHOWR|nr:alpha/beta hydrolase [Rhodococcus wratislaviensis]GAF49524.1 hypothetical protein RW1_093_00110 [Rhodococcus wratislaviensis NBRC 100605]
MKVAILPGAGSAGLTWETVAAQLDASIHPLPDMTSVEEIATNLLDELPDSPVVLVGASLGAMIAVELTHRRPIAGMVLLAAGFGVTVSDEVLARFDDPDPNFLARMARGGVAEKSEALINARLADFEARGVDVLAHHLRALATYQPVAPSPAVPTVVIQGEFDRSVPLADHVDLARQCRGLLCPIAGIGHSAYLEAPDEVVRLTREIISEAEEASHA